MGTFHFTAVVVLDPIKCHALDQAVVDRRVLTGIGLGEAGVSTFFLVVAAVNVRGPVMVVDLAGVGALEPRAGEGVPAAGPVVFFHPVLTHRHRLLNAIG